ncbi:hypothetical protein KXS07_21440 [Inquilinus limosus]|uniref:hypothetical protein n=1 Tax=Inquilinus limosus TaxID=171674 RepID=UPI003F139B03
MRTAICAIAAIALTLVAFGSAQAGTDECGPVRDVIARLNAAPYIQQRGLVTKDGQSYSSDLLAFEDKEYSRSRNGSWQVGPRRQTPLVVDGKAAIFECQRVGSEVLDGVVTAIYTYKRLMPTRKVVRDVRLWVVDSTGLPARSQIEVDMGKGRGRAEFTFSYDADAVPPAVGDP